MCINLILNTRFAQQVPTGIIPLLIPGSRYRTVPVPTVKKHYCEYYYRLRNTAGERTSTSRLPQQASLSEVDLFCCGIFFGVMTQPGLPPLRTIVRNLQRGKVVKDDVFF